MEQIRCKHCRSKNKVEAGKSRRKKRFLCKNCNKHFTIGDNRRGRILYDEKFKLKLKKEIEKLRHDKQNGKLSIWGAYLKLEGNKKKFPTYKWFLKFYKTNIINFNN